MFSQNVAQTEYDVAIIGTGPAGITTAIKLADQTQAKIALIESGGIDYDTQISQLAQVNASGDLNNGSFSAHTQPIFGGASQVWAGQCAIGDFQASVVQRSNATIEYFLCTSHFGQNNVN